MRPRSMILPLCLARMLGAVAAWGQPDLPPPPPPPMGPTDVAPAPPVRAPAAVPTQAFPPTPAAQGRAAPATAPHPSPPPATPTSTPPQPLHAAGRRRPDVTRAGVEEERGRPLALTINPLGVTLGRISANAEALFAPHHALVISPNVLPFEVGRGGRHDLISEGFGYATQTSASYGIELGYHYWLRSRRSLRGTFLGASLLGGTTTDPSVGGPPSHTQGYWGVAFDAGLQEVMPVGFTIGGGIGLGVLRMGDATAVFPRLLLQTGWSL